MQVCQILWCAEFLHYPSTGCATNLKNERKDLPLLYELGANELRGLCGNEWI